MNLAAIILDPSLLILFFYLADCSAPLKTRCPVKVDWQGTYCNFSCESNHHKPRGEQTSNRWCSAIILDRKERCSLCPVGKLIVIIIRGWIFVQKINHGNYENNTRQNLGDKLGWLYLLLIPCNKV